MNKINIFVYGSLREGFFNYDKYLKGKVIKNIPAVLKGMELYHMPYKGYPAIVPNENNQVFGEIMVVNDYDETIKAIDEMEGVIDHRHPENEYHKELLTVEHLDTGIKEDCYVYFYNLDNDSIFNEKAIHIPDGDWKKYMLNK